MFKIVSEYINRMVDEYIEMLPDLPEDRMETKEERIILHQVYGNRDDFDLTIHSGGY